MSQPAQQLGQLVAQRFLELGVERGQRLVQQQHARAHGHRARQCHALALAAGELGGALLLQAAQAHQVDQLADARAAPRRARCRGCAGHSRCWLPPSSAERARSSGTPCRRRAAPPAAPVTSWSPKRMRPPASGDSRPAIRRSRVVLPQPEGPSSASTSPGSTCSVGRLQAARAVGDRSWRTLDEASTRRCAQSVSMAFLRPGGPAYCRPHSTGRMTMKKTSV